MTAAARVVLGVALVAVSGPAGFLAYRILQAGHESTSPAGAPPAGARIGAAAAPGLIRHPAPEQLPDLKLPDPQGVSHSLSEWRGHPLVVNFWATWCEPCRREIPLLKELRARHASMDLKVVGIAVDFRDAVVPFARRMGIDYPILIGEDEGLKAVDAFGVEAVFPFSVFADPQGRIVGIKIGELHPEDADLILDRLASLETGRLGLAEARRQVADGLGELAAKRAQHPQGGEAIGAGKS